MAFDSKDFDDFWDIESLMPKKKKRPASFATAPATTTVEVGGDAKLSATERTSLSMMRGMRETEDESYSPEGYGLINRVTIRRLRDRYDFYENFRRAALLYFDAKGARCDFVQYYSYMPQYSQLSSEQKSYYLYFRDSVRRGEYVKTDYSYLYLYVYEILNLPDKIPPSEGIILLIRILREYRRALPRIEGTLAVWIEDYCLVHKLPCPTLELGDMLHSLVSLSRLREFYFSSADIDSREVVDVMTAQLSDYDPRRGKLFSGEMSELLLSNYRGAMRCVLARLKKDGKLMPSGESRTVSRDAFPMSLCTHTVKCRLDIEYTAITDCESLRREVTAAVRYTENMLRAVVGIKSRLGVNGLPEPLKREIDDYFARQRMRGGSLAPKQELPEYEKLYSAPDAGLSAKGADEIERASWSTTIRLVEYGDDRPETDIVATPAPAPTTSAPQEQDVTHRVESCTPGDTLGDAARAALVRAYDYTYCDGEGMSDDAAAEEINEYFVELIGDVVLEHDGEFYKIIDDYKEDIEQWML